MSSASKLAVLALLVPLAACASAAEPAVSGGSDEPTAEVTANLAICGENTLASIVGEGGRRLTFCVTKHGREIIAEDAPVGLASVLPRPSRSLEATARAKRDTCALDVFLANTAKDVPVPVAVKESCERRLGRSVEIAGRTLSAKAVLQASPAVAAGGGIGGAVEPTNVQAFNESDATKYCNLTTGPVAFFHDFCLDLCTLGIDCVQACTPQLWGGSVRQCPESDFAFEDVVSCNGFTRVFADARDGSGDPWVNELDTFVGPHRHLLVSIDDGLGGWSDSDLRIRGASLPGASHMHAFQCFDP